MTTQLITLTQPTSLHAGEHDVEDAEQAADDGADSAA
jgi:hypothetical protein